MSQSSNGKNPGRGDVFQFNLAGLFVFCLCLIAGASLITLRVNGARPRRTAHPALARLSPEEPEGQTPSRPGPWGELLTQDISLQRPVEYLNQELKTIQPPVWVFHGMNVQQVEALFITNGLSQPEAEKALAPDRLGTQGTDALLKPSEDFVFSLSSETRDRLYGALRGRHVNVALDWPYCYARSDLESVLADTHLYPDDLALFKQLLYGGNGAWRFSDFDTLMGKIPTLERRTAMAASLSRQPAVLAALRIRADTDINEMAAYWGHLPNGRFAELRPILEAIKRLPKGGTVSLVYLLPPFAREHLYTYPLPPKPGEPTPDCHWSVLNFSSVKPDNRFFDFAERDRYIVQNYSEVVGPHLCGDVVVFLDEKGGSRHSAVYLAEDLVFTKNGENYTMPWILMRIPDLHAIFPDCKIFYFRNKAG